MSGNKYNFDVHGGKLSYYIQNIDTSNLVDGKSVYYWVGRENQQVPDDAGFVGIVNSTNITVSNLTLTNNGVGVLFAYTNNSRIENVNASNNGWGICLKYSSNNTLINNTMSGNADNFGVFGDALSHYIQNIDTSNLIDGKIIYYWVGRENQQVPDDAGFVGIVNSTNITVSNLTLTNNIRGVLFAYTNDSRIVNVNASFFLYSSSNNTLMNNMGGIGLRYSGINTLINNTGGIDMIYSINTKLMNNMGSICLDHSSNNTLISNTALNKSFGIFLWDSNDNMLANNNVSYNWLASGCFLRITTRLQTTWYQTTMRASGYIIRTTIRLRTTPC